MVGASDSGHQLEGEVAEALRLCAQVQEIIVSAAHYSAKVTEFSGQVAKAGQQFGTMYARHAMDAGNAAGGLVGGLAIAAGGLVLGNLLGSLANSWNEFKNARALEEVLENKRKLAAQKAGVLERCLPMIERSLSRVDRTLASDAAILVTIETVDRAEPLNNQLTQLFNMHFELARSVIAGRFLLGEFSAWMNGQQDSGAPTPDPMEAWMGAIGVVRRASALPASGTGPFSVGALFLFRSHDAMKVLHADEELQRSLARVVNRRLLRGYIPGDSTFKAYYARCFAPSPVVTEMVRRRATKTVAMAASLAAIVTCAWFGPTWVARWRIGVAVGDQDPCAVHSLTPGQVARATADQREAIQLNIKRCETATASVRCKTLAREISEGELSDASRTLAGQAVGMLDRVAKNRILPTDLSVSKDGFPCGNTGGAEAVWSAYVDAVASSEVWGAAPPISTDLKNALVRRVPILEPGSQKALHDGVERLAQKAQGWKLSPELNAAVAGCDLEVALTFTNGVWCKQARARARALASPSGRPAVASSTPAASSSPGPAPARSASGVPPAPSSNPATDDGF